MNTFKVALIDKTAEQIPDWVPDELADAGIEFAFGNCQDQAELLAMAEDTDLLWIYGGSQLANAENLPLLPNCRGVIRSGSGTDRIDHDAATKLGMVVINTPHAHHDAVSDHTIALIFAVGRQIVAQDRYQRQDGWIPWAQTEHKPFWRLNNKTLGLVGFGLIPRFVARKLSGFDLDVLVYDPYVDEALLTEHNAQRVELDDLLKRADIVSIHTPLTKETHHLISVRELQMMKSNAILVNTARGPVIEEAALVEALDKKWISGPVWMSSRLNQRTKKTRSSFTTMWSSRPTPRASPTSRLN